MSRPHRPGRTGDRNFASLRARDGLIPVAYAEALAEGITGARRTVLPGAGHFPMIEAEDAFVAAVEEFLDAG